LEALCFHRDVITIFSLKPSLIQATKVNVVCFLPGFFSPSKFKVLKVTGANSVLDPHTLNADPDRGLWQYGSGSRIQVPGT